MEECGDTTCLHGSGEAGACGLHCLLSITALEDEMFTMPLTLPSSVTPPTEPSAS